MRAEQRMRIERDCRWLSLEFAMLNDSRRYEALVELFTPDGIFRRPLAPDNPLQGREAILSDLRRKAVDVVSHHVCTNIHISVIDEHDAEGSVYYTVYRHSGVVESALAFRFSGTVYVGNYSDRYRRTPQGWLFSDRVARNRFFLEGQTA